MSIIWFGKLIKKFLSFKHKLEHQGLKIDSINEDPERGLLCLTVRINGKCTPPIKKMPYEFLMENSGKATSMLSHEDFNDLIQALLENYKRVIKKRYDKTYSLINHQFSKSTGEPFLIYQNYVTKQFYIKPAKKIFSDIDLIQNFDSKDCACIGNIVGSYDSERELKINSRGVVGDNVIIFDSSVLQNG